MSESASLGYAWGAMTLDVGDIDRLDAPTAEQVRQFLRVPPPRAPYLVLTADGGLTMQATLAPPGEHYRVEYRDVDGRRWHAATLDFDAAFDVLERFRRGDASFRRVIAWRRHHAWEDAHSPAVLALVGVPVLALAAWGVWEMLR